MMQTLDYHIVASRLRHFFQYQKGFIEVPAQSRLSILAACEQPETLTKFSLGNTVYPLPQTGQMWLEYELLKNPAWPGVFCCTTSYRDEPHIIEGRHSRIFPMFEFEATGDFDTLKKLEAELLAFLGFSTPLEMLYHDTCELYETDTIEAAHEQALEKRYGPVIFLTNFPQRSQPFWNMKRHHDGTFQKVDVLLYGMETIGSAARETDIALMRERFFELADGRYAAVLFEKFGRERVMQELDEYCTLPMIERFGAGIGMTRLVRACREAGILQESSVHTARLPEQRISVAI
jgi:aspartyl/asparaginyl-tRNA synthetase